MKRWLSQTATDLGRGIAEAEIDPVDLTEVYLEAIENSPHRDDIYCRVTAGRARAEAKDAAMRARAGQRLGLLDGVPVSWKDLFDTAGVATEAGSALLQGRVPEQDAEVLHNATSAGLVCLGKTHMSELAFSGLGLNPVTATSPNINDKNAVPGGSSSGAAASVAFMLAPCGIGSDTGGSVRLPAAWNDLVGLKTTSGRLSLKGVVPLIESLDTVGPLCRSVEDCAQMLAVLEGGKPAVLGDAPLKGLRLAALRTVVTDDLQDAPRHAHENALERLRSAGAVIDRIDAPEVEEALALSVLIFAPEAYGTWAELIEANPDKMFKPVLDRFRGGKAFSAYEYVAGWRRLREIRDIWNARVAPYDAVLLPASPILPPDHARLLSDETYYAEQNMLCLRNTRVGNLLGISAMSLPTGIPSCGLMLFGKPFGEEALLRAARSIEDALS